jgi:hypothetical protein
MGPTDTQNKYTYEEMWYGELQVKFFTEFYDHKLN